MQRVSVDFDPRPALRFLRELEELPDTEHQVTYLRDRADLELMQLVASFAALSVEARRLAEDVTVYLIVSRNVALTPGAMYQSDEPSDAAKLDRLLRDLDKSPDDC